MDNIKNLKDLIIYQSQNNENVSVEVLYNERPSKATQDKNYISDFDE